MKTFNFLCGFVTETVNFLCRDDEHHPMDADNQTIRIGELDVSLVGRGSVWVGLRMVRAFLRLFCPNLTACLPVSLLLLSGPPRRDKRARTTSGVYVLECLSLGVFF